MPNAVNVAVMTDAGGAHLGAYFSALLETPEVGTVVLSDPSGHSAESAKKTLGGKLTKTYANHRDMLQAERPVMALISLEAVASPPVIELALDAGCHVYAEKPACIRAEDFEQLVRKADQKHLYLMPAFANRINPPNQEARRLIQAGAIGELYGLEMHLVADQTRLTRPAYHQTWFADKKRAGGGHLSWLGIHWLDLAMFITGSRITDVAGFTANVGGQPISVEDSAVLSLKFANGALGTLTSGYYLQRGYHSHLKIWGSGGWLHLEPLKDVPLRWADATKSPEQIREYNGPRTPSGYAPYVREAVRASAGLQQPPITNAEGLIAVRTVFAGYRAAETGTVQKVLDWP